MLAASVAALAASSASDAVPLSAVWISTGAAVIFVVARAAEIPMEPSFAVRSNVPVVAGAKIEITCVPATAPVVPPRRPKAPATGVAVIEGDARFPVKVNRCRVHHQQQRCQMNP